MQLQQRKGQLAGWEALIIVILIGYAGYMTFLWAKKPSENSIYQSGSKPVVTDVHMSPFSCMREGALDAIATGNKTDH